MAVGGEVLISGPYAATWNGVALGLTEGEGGLPTLTTMAKSKPVNSSNLYGATKIESVHLGADMTLEMILLEYLKGIAALWPFGTWGALGAVGTFKSALAKPLVLTAVAGTPASASPATWTASMAVISDDHQGKIRYGPEVRTVPLKFDLYPYARAGNAANLGFFVET